MSFSFDKKQEKNSSVAGKQAAQQSSASAQSAASHILRLQQTAGNRAVGSLLNLEPDGWGPVPDGEGLPLQSGVRSLFEQRFGKDFSHVRVHTGGGAADAARALDAVAYTVGNDVVFDAGKFNPQSKQGQHLLAHELSHVVQQSRGGDAPSSFDSGSGLEHGAARAAAQFSGGAQPVSVSGASSAGVARQESPDVPFWKKVLNPVYQKAVDVLPKPAAEKLEELNEAGRALLKSGVVTNDQLNALTKVAEPFVQPVQQTLEIMKPAPVRSVDVKKTDDKAAPEGPGILETAGAVFRIGFTMATHQTPEHFGKGMIDKAKSVTVDPVMTIYGPEGMLDKAAQKGVDQLEGKPDRDYVTKEEHENQLRAIVHVGGALFPGVGEVTVTTPPASMATSPAGAAAVAQGTVVVPSVVTSVPVVVMSTGAGGTGGGGSDPVPDRLVVGRGKKTGKSSIDDPAGMTTKTLAPKSAQPELESFLEDAPTKFPQMAGKVKEILLERMGLNPTGVKGMVNPQGVKAARELLQPGGTLRILQQPMKGQTIIEVEAQIRGMLPASEWGEITVTVHKEKDAVDAVLVTAKKL